MDLPSISSHFNTRFTNHQIALYINFDTMVEEKETHAQFENQKMEYTQTPPQIKIAKNTNFT